jgi:hypothetical protein
MLELTLALPLLLLIMALMVNYGTVACWKVRALAVADYTISGVRYPRTAATLPRPGSPHSYYWPAPGATYSVGDWNAPAADVARLQLPVARGPLLDPNMGPDRTPQVHSQLLDPSRGFGEGNSRLVRPFAMVARWGRFQLHGHHSLLANLWQYRQTHLGSNVNRRLDVLYTLLKAPAGYSSAYTGAVWAILNSAWIQDLLPLERDLPDFPGIDEAVCSLDLQLIEQIVQRLIEVDIPDVPNRLERAVTSGTITVP